MKNPRNLKKKGFTLVEILIVLAIISTVVLVGVSSYSIVRKKIRLDIAANNIESIIAEARDRTKAGYHEPGGRPFCFGFRIEQGKYIDSLQTYYNRLEDIKCSRAEADIKKRRIGEIDEGIEIKEIEMLGDLAEYEVLVFFVPPNAKPEIWPIEGDIDEDPILRIVIGFRDSDHALDKREVIFNALTANVYTRKYKSQ